MHGTKTCGKMPANSVSQFISKASWPPMYGTWQHFSVQVPFVLLLRPRPKPWIEVTPGHHAEIGSRGCLTPGGTESWFGPMVGKLGCLAPMWNHVFCNQTKFQSTHCSCEASQIPDGPKGGGQLGPMAMEIHPTGGQQPVHCPEAILHHATHASAS